LVGITRTETLLPEVVHGQTWVRAADLQQVPHVVADPGDAERPNAADRSGIMTVGAERRTYW
jgi:hypothetical protein